MKKKLWFFILASAVLSAVLVGYFFLFLKTDSIHLPPPENPTEGFEASPLAGKKVTGNRYTQKEEESEEGKEKAPKRRRTGLGDREKESVLRAKALNVDLFYLENGKEVPASRGKVYVRIFGSCNPIGPAGKKKGDSLPPRWVFPCDELGRASIPLASLVRKGGSGGVAFCVRAESSNGEYSTPRIRLNVDDFGRYFLSGSAPPTYLGDRWRLRLFPNAVLTILVKDDFGKAVEGVPVGLFRPYRPLTSPGAWANVFLLRAGKTGKGGKCRFNLPVEKGKGQWAWMILNVFAGFNFPVPHLDRWFKRVEVEGPGKKEIVLRMPPTGKVVVDIMDWKEIQKEGKNFWVWLGDMACEERMKAYFRHLYAISEAPFIEEKCRKIENGHIVFPFVGVGMKLVVFGFEEGRWRHSSKEILGPSFPGEVVTAALARPCEDPVVSGVLLGPSGRPFRKRRFLVYEGRKNANLEIDFSSPSLLLSSTTDESGRFRIPLPWEGSHAKFPIDHLRISSLGDLGEKFPPFWIVPLPPPFSKGERFLGKFRMQTPPLLAEGIVVDVKGMPVEAAEIRCYRPIIRAGKAVWVPVLSATGLTDATGRWFVKGFWKWPELKVMAIKKGAGSSDRVLVRPGTKGLKLLISGSGNVEARLLVSKKVYLERKMLKAQLVPRELWVKGSNQKTSKEVFPDGRVLWKNLLPGIYDFRVCAQGDPDRPVVLVPRIRVVPGKMNKDPRIQGVDLRGLVEEFTVLAKDPSGKVLAPGHMWIKSGVWAGSMLDPSKKGLTALRRVGDAPAIEIVYPGYKRKKIRAQDKVVEVVLERAET